MIRRLPKHFDTIYVAVGGVVGLALIIAVVYLISLWLKERERRQTNGVSISCIVIYDWCSNQSVDRALFRQISPSDRVSQWRTADTLLHTPTLQTTAQANPLPVSNLVSHRYEHTLICGGS